jgi:hypothetical protein
LERKLGQEVLGASMLSEAEGVEDASTLDPVAADACDVPIEVFSAESIVALTQRRLEFRDVDVDTASVDLDPLLGHAGIEQPVAKFGVFQAKRSLLT